MILRLSACGMYKDIVCSCKGYNAKVSWINSCKDIVSNKGYGFDATLNPNVSAVAVGFMHVGKVSKVSLYLDCSYDVGLLSVIGVGAYKKGEDKPVWRDGELNPKSKQYVFKIPKDIDYDYIVGAFGVINLRPESHHAKGLIKNLKIEKPLNIIPIAVITGLCCAGAGYVLFRK